ncbi:MAG: hypothetical protein Q8P22_01630 [Chloroflexota bacterium]|nr:hypothetical protein [Chloroflexota bacterium]
MDTAVQALPRSDRAGLLAVVLGVGMAFYLAIEPTQGWILLLLAGLAALGTDGVVRSHPASPFARPDDTAAFLFLPALLALGGGLFLEDVVGGYASIGAAVATVPAFAAVLYGEYLSVDARPPAYTAARLAVNIAAYIAAFAFFSVVYEFELGLLAAAFSVGVVSLLLSVEMLREVALAVRPTLVYAGAIALVLAQVTWALHFLPLEGFLAAAFLLLALYIATGVAQNYLLRQLDLATGAEFAAVAAVGLAIVVIAHSVS